MEWIRLGETSMRKLVQEYFDEQLNIINGQIAKLEKAREGGDRAKSLYQERRFIEFHMSALSTYVTDSQKGKYGIDIESPPREEETMLFLKGFYKGATNGNN